MTYGKYYTSEQLGQLEERAGEVGEERILAVQQEWTAVSYTHLTLPTILLV